MKPSKSTDKSIKKLLNYKEKVILHYITSLPHEVLEIFARELCISAAYAVMRCPSVMFVNSVKTNKRIFKIFPCRVAKPLQSFRTKLHANIRTVTPPNMGVECRWGRHKSRFLTNSWLSIDDCCSANNRCDRDRAVYRIHRHASVNLCLSQTAAWTTTTKRTEQN